MIPWKRTAVTGTPASRSLLAYASPSSGSTLASVKNDSDVRKPKCSKALWKCERRYQVWRQRNFTGKSFRLICYLA